MVQLCIICFELIEKWSSDSPFSKFGTKTGAGTLNLFLKLLERYLGSNTAHDVNCNGDVEAMRFLWEKVIETGMSTCEECSKMAISFCKCYHQMMSIEVILNYKLWVFAEILRCAHHTNGIDHELTDLKTKPLKKCARKLQNTFPKILLRRENSQIRTVASNLNTSFTSASKSDTSHTIGNQIVRQTSSEDSNSCIFCNKLKNSDILTTPHNSDAATNAKITVYLKRFFKLLGRYLDESNLQGEKNKTVQLQDEKVIFTEIFTCGTCLKLTGSFCELYHKMTSLEVLLQWEVQKLWDTMSTAQQSPTQMCKFKNEALEFLSEVEGFSVEERIILIIDFNSNLIAKCANKLRMTFPRVTLKEHRSKPDNLIPMISTTAVPDDFVAQPSPSKERHTKLRNRKAIAAFYSKSKPVVTYSESENAKRRNKMSRLKPILNNLHDKSSTSQSSILPDSLYENDEIKIEHSNNEKGEGLSSVKLEKADENILQQHLKYKLSQPLQIKGKTRDQPTHSDEASLAMTTDDLTQPVSKNLLSQSSKPVRITKSTFNSKSGKIQCNVCGKTFPGLWRLKQHQKSCDISKDPSAPRPPNSNPDVQKHKCSSCPREYVSKYEMNYHYQVAHGGVTHQCDRCKTFFTSNSSLQMHHRSTKCALQGSLPVKLKHMCDVCGQGFTRATILKRHLNGVHLKLQDNVCSYCGRRFSQDSSLKRHIETIHLEKREHLCDLCGMGFKWKSSLDGHRRNVHGETSKTTYAQPSLNAISGIDTDKSSKETVIGMNTTQGFPTAAAETFGGLTNNETSGVLGVLTESTDKSVDRIPIQNLPQNCPAEDEESIPPASPLDFMEIVDSPEVPNDEDSYQPDLLNYLQESSNSVDWKATSNKVKSSSNLAHADEKDADNTFPKSFENSKNKDTPATASFYTSDDTEAQSGMEVGAETPETCVVHDSANAEVGSSKKEVKRTRASLRSLYHCKICTKTFSTSTKLEEHYQSRACMKNSRDYLQTEQPTKTKFKKCERRTLPIPSVRKIDLETGPTLTMFDNADSQMPDSNVKIEPVDLPIINVDQNKMEPSGDPNEVGSIISPRESHKGVGIPISVFNIETGKHKCILCPKEFHHKHDAGVHYSRIHDKVLQVCPTCGKRFGSNRAYQAHWRRVHSGAPYKCPGCNTSFALEHKLKRHHEITECTASKGHEKHKLVIPPSIIQNDSDDQEPQTKSTDNSNKIQKYQRKPRRPIKPRKCSTNSMSAYNNKTGKHKCSLCPQEFTFRCDAIIHYKRRHVQDRYVCPICGKKFLCERDYQGHWRIVHTGVAYKCLGCRKTFKQKKTLTCHYKVKECTASQGSEVVNSTEAVLPMPPPIIKDFDDDDVKPTDKLLKKRAVRKPRPRGSPKRSKQPKTPKRAIKPETGKFKCSLCEKEYATANQCKYHHEAVHLGVKYKCDICNQLFAVRSYLRQHQRLFCFPIGKSLADKDKHVCHLCGKVFIMSKTLKRHINTVHVKLHDNVCSQCGRRFSQLASLKRHVEAVHLERREHLCDLCGRGFKYKFSLAGHRRSVHGEGHTGEEVQPMLSSITRTDGFSETT